MIQDGKKTRSDDCNRSDEIWAMSYSVIGASSVLTPPLSWKFRLFEREELTGSTQEQNRWLKTASGKAITRNCTAPEDKRRRKVYYIAHGGSGKSLSESGYQESHSTEWTSENSTMQ